jgi:2-polyprenyl-3-methyl-5-hydroxy-6-metoxy-1,4-benzoquinol methylase
MNCCQCQGIEELFNDQLVNKDLAQYRVKGPSQTTRLLTKALKEKEIQGLSLLDIGGGVGAVQYELLASGCQSAMDVDASKAYLHAAQEEAQRRGLAERISYQHGNFVDLAPKIPEADIVTLDRVICCFDDMEKLVSLSAGRARKLYGVVFPRDVWWIRIGMKILNFIMRLRHSSYRSFVHPTRAVEALVSSYGLNRKYYHHTALWQVIVYSK